MGISIIFKPLEFALLQLTWILKHFQQPWGARRRMLCLPPQSRRLFGRMCQLHVTVCLHVDRLFLPVPLCSEKETECGLSFQTAVPCTHSKPPDILPISLCAPHSWPLLACAHLGQRSALATPWLVLPCSRRTLSVALAFDLLLVLHKGGERNLS